MIVFGKWLQRHERFLNITKRALRYNNTSFLSQTIHGITFQNPIGLSAGLDKNIELVPLMHAIGFGYMEGGSITYRHYAGNPRPWFYRLPRSKSLVVHAGLANNGAPRILKHLMSHSYKTPSGFPLNISVAKTNSPEAVSEHDAINDYVNTLKLLKSTDIGSMYTLNISCPNTYGGEPFTKPTSLNHLLQAVDQLKLQKPLFIKMPIDLSWDKFYRLLKVADRHNVAGVTIGNLTKRRLRLDDNLPTSVKGNLSGLPTKHHSTYLIHQTYAHFNQRFTIIGVGGIFSAKDAYEKICHGATIVELVTGLIYEGPQLVGNMNHDLVKLLKKDGYENINQAVGTAHSPNPGSS